MLITCSITFAQTNVTTLKTAKFKELNIQLPVPKNTLTLAQDTTTKDQRLIGYKSVWLGIQPYSKADLEDCAINIEIIRLEKSQTQAYIAGTNFFFFGYSMFYSNKNIISTNLTLKVLQVSGHGIREVEGKHDHLVQLRKDYVDKDGALILCGATIFAGQDELQCPTNAVTQISRLVNSIQFLK